MNTTFRKSLIASGIALTLATFGSNVLAAATVTQDVIEARQETQIWTTYALNPYLRANDLKVSVDSGKATLTGKVSEDVSKDLAKQIALGVSGIQQVDNQILVEADFVPVAATSAERGYGQTIEDATITSAVKSKLLWSSKTDGLTADVDTIRGHVVLKGTAQTAKARDLAGRMARNTHGVTSVDNQLVVGGPTPTISAEAKAAGTEAKTDVADGWITTKVKSTFLYSTGVDGGDISVDTRNGVVTLSGKVDSKAERATAIELAGNVRGVKSVKSTGLTL